MKLSFNQWNYKSVRQSNSVVVLCAGPSVKANGKKILSYIESNNSVVFAANYNYGSIGLSADFTYVANDFKLGENEAKIVSPIIVPAKIFSGKINSKIAKNALKSHQERGLLIYMSGSRKDPTTYKFTKGPLKVNKDGSLSYSRLSSAGHGCMLLSLVCRPKRLLLVGMDGPVDSQCKEKLMFDGKRVKYKKPRKNENFKNHFIDVILPTLVHYGVVVETYNDVGIYGLNKKKLGLRVLP